MSKNSVWVKADTPIVTKHSKSESFFCGDFRGNSFNAPLFGLIEVVQGDKYSFAQNLIVLSTPPNKQTFLDSDLEWRKQTRLFVLHYSVTGLEANPKIGEKEIENLWVMLADLLRDKQIEELPIETFMSFSPESRRKLWIKTRNFWIENEKWFYEQIKINRKSVLDYLNLQALGLDEYQKTIALQEEDPKTNPLTIRDRIQYARKMGWLEKPSYGSRKSNQLRLNKEENDI